MKDIPITLSQHSAKIDPSCNVDMITLVTNRLATRKTRHQWFIKVARDKSSRHQLVVSTINDIYYFGFN